MVPGVRHMLWMTLENFNIATPYTSLLGAVVLPQICCGKNLYIVLKINCRLGCLLFWPQKRIYLFPQICCSSGQSSTISWSLLTVTWYWRMMCLFKFLPTLSFICTCISYPTRRRVCGGRAGLERWQSIQTVCYIVWKICYVNYVFMNCSHWSFTWGNSNRSQCTI